MSTSKEKLINLLKATLTSVENDDSLQGRIYYEVDGLGTFYVEAMVRIGNSEGQGGSIIIQDEQENNEISN